MYYDSYSEASEMPGPQRSEEEATAFEQEMPVGERMPTEAGSVVSTTSGAATTGTTAAGSTPPPPPSSPPAGATGSNAGTAGTSGSTAGTSGSATGTSGNTAGTSGSTTGTSGSTSGSTGGTVGSSGTTTIETLASGPTLPGELGGPKLNPDEIAFLTELESPDFSIESQISEPEAIEAILLFAVVNIMLAGQSHYKVGAEDKTDVLGVLTLFYGLQDKSVADRLRIPSIQAIWPKIQPQLKALRDQLDILGADADQLFKEAKRQFNLGRNNDVTGNTVFPGLFQRYVDITADPLLTLDIRKEQHSDFSDKQKVGEALILLRELKEVILQIVRSLSENGTVATSQANQDWAKYEKGALDVLLTVAQSRTSDDLTLKNPWKTLADLTGKDRDTEVAPYVALGRDGANLLGLAFETYHRTKDQIDNFDEQYLLDLFQAQGDASQFLTTLMRKESTVIKRHPLAGWA